VHVGMIKGLTRCYPVVDFDSKSSPIRFTALIRLAKVKDTDLDVSRVLTTSSKA
jgi:hypothetical protein